MQEIKLIDGDIYKDERGEITFVNEFDLKTIRRFYHIHHNDKQVVRAWQGHRLESKWFHCTRGSFIIKLILIDNWNRPSKNLKNYSFELSSKLSQVLFIPNGYVNGFQAMENKSSLLVFSDKDLDSSSKDDYRFDKNFWFNWTT